MQATVYWVKDTVVNPQQVYEGDDPRHEFKQASSYKGEWKNGKKCGYGVQTWQNGYKYEGNWRDDKRNGDGVLWTLKAGKMFKQYSGNWVNDLKQGMGVYYLKDGGRYEGEWKSDKRDGHGSFFFPDGSVYVGEWSDDNMSGFGTLSKANGDIYEGEWLNGKREGAGIFFYKGREKVYDGEWVDDIAKCGVYMDAADFFVSPSTNSKRASSARAVSSSLTRLQSDLPLDKQMHRRHGARIPELRLAEPEQLLAKEIRGWQLKRQAARNLPFLVPEMLFSAEALFEMRRVFTDACRPSPSALSSAANPSASFIEATGSLSSTELPRVMASLSSALEPSEAELTQLLSDLGKLTTLPASQATSPSATQVLGGQPSAASEKPQKLPFALSSSPAALSFSDFVKAIFRLNQLREASEEVEEGLDAEYEAVAAEAAGSSQDLGVSASLSLPIGGPPDENDSTTPGDTTKRNVRFE